MMTPSRSFKVVLAWCFLVAVSCFAPVDIRRAMILSQNGIGSTGFGRLAALPIAARQTKLGIPVRLQAVPSGSSSERSGNPLFELQGANSRRFSLRRIFQKLFQLRIRLFKSLAALFVAACLWFSVGLVEATTTAHSPQQTAFTESSMRPAPAQIERVYNHSVMRISGGSDQQAATAIHRDADGRIVVGSSKININLPATAIVGTAVVATTSVGFLKNKDKTTSSKTDTTDDGDKSNDSSTEATTKNSATIDEDNSEEIKTDPMVQKVLERAKQTRLQVTPDAYLKSFEQEKDMIASALNELNERMEQSAAQEKEKAPEEKEADKVDKVVDAISSPLQESLKVDTVEAKGETDKKVTESMATTTDLPLMTEEFVKARKQPKDKGEEERLSQKYAQFTSLEDKAFQILVDLGMIEVTRDDDEDEKEILTERVPEATSGEIEEEPFQ